MFASIFTTLIVKPLFNLLTFIYALLPGHNFGLSIILFTIIIRLLLWPLVKKQLHQAKGMRALQPELKRIKRETKGDRQKESMMVMELYKERGISPFGSIGIILIQLPILFGLYAGLRKIITDPHTVVTFSYPFIQNLSWMKQLGSDISKFDNSLFGVIDLSRAAINKSGGVYWPAMAIVVGSAAAQFFQSKQLLPQDKDARKLRHILRDAGKGNQAEQGEVNAAVGRTTQYFIPVMIFLFTVNIASALSLYWLTSGLVAIFQQAKVLKSDETELEDIADSSETVVTKGKPSNTTKAASSGASATAGRRAGAKAGTVKPGRGSTARVVLEGEVVTPPKTKTQTPTKKGKSKRRKR